MHSKLNEEQNLRKVAKSLYIFLATSDEVKKYVKMMQSNSSDNWVHCYNVEMFINTKPVIKNKFKELPSELTNSRVQEILVLEYKKRNDRKIFHSSTKLIAGTSGTDKAFVSMRQSIMIEKKVMLVKIGLT